MFPCNVAHDGVSLKFIFTIFLLLQSFDNEGSKSNYVKKDDEGDLGQLDVSVNEIREVWEIEAKGELVVEPARLVKVRS